MILLEGDGGWGGPRFTACSGGSEVWKNFSRAGPPHAHRRVAKLAYVKKTEESSAQRI